VAPVSPLKKLPNRSPDVGQLGSPHQQIPNAPVRQLNKLPQSTAASNRRTPGAIRPMNTAQNAAKVFSNSLVKPFQIVKAAFKHKGMIQNGPGEWIPKGNVGKLGKFLGGGFNSRVYSDKGNSKFVHKLVPLLSFKEGGKQTVENLDRESSITDQLAGRTILQRLKQTYKGKGLDRMMQIAEMDGEPTVWEVEGPNKTIHKFAHTKEQNISSPVFTVDAKGRQKAIRGDDGKFVLATNAMERVLIRAKNRVREQAAAKGEKIKLSEIGRKKTAGSNYKYILTDNDLNQALTTNEELTISTVLRGLNHNGIVWTDHKLQNLDIVKEPKSPTGYKVIFFDFDGFRPVNGNNRAERKQIARDAQNGFDHILDGATDNNAMRYRNQFDFTAFGGQNLPTLRTFGANRFRQDLATMNNMTAEQFDKTLNAATGGKMKTTSPNI
jgi:hypothetical protein